jgi:roadblock/LC7 domain-containing protein
MTDLNNLLKIKGVFAVGSFDDNGNLTGYAGEITEDEAAMAASMSAANMHMARMQCDGFTAMSGEGGWTPAVGFALTGPLFTVCVEGNVGVFARNGEASFNEIFRALRG